ncbi:MAG TPA: hypothetical protein VMU39_12140 [Solirubrobacteraceae bacterium]|nr:hypothetical protein [Solirubrobacteraceae bacterium]
MFRRVAAAFVTGPVAFFIAAVLDIAALLLATIRAQARQRLVHLNRRASPIPRRPDR